MTFKHSIPVMQTTVDMETGEQTSKEVRFDLAPPRPDVCQVCAVKHEPELFHDCRSLFYQYAFYGRQGRWPTWADASAHCAPFIVEGLEAVLEAKKMKWSQPPPGTPCVPHLGDDPAAPEGST